MDTGEKTTEVIQKKKRKPTLRQRKLIKIISENNGITMGQAMLKAGYSAITANNPQQITKSENWQLLMDKYLPDNLLAKTAKTGLKAKRWLTSPTEPDREVPDLPTRHKYLETALKMKGKLVERVDTTSAGQQITGFTFIAPSKPDEPIPAEEVEDN